MYRGGKRHSYLHKRKTSFDSYSSLSWCNLFSGVSYLPDTDRGHWIDGLADRFFSGNSDTTITSSYTQRFFTRGNIRRYFLALHIAGSGGRCYDLGFVYI